MLGAPATQISVYPLALSAKKRDKPYRSAWFIFFYYYYAFNVHLFIYNKMLLKPLI